MGATDGYWYRGEVARRWHDEGVVNRATWAEAEQEAHR